MPFHKGGRLTFAQIENNRGHEIKNGERKPYKQRK